MEEERGLRARGFSGQFDGHILLIRVNQKSPYEIRKSQHDSPVIVSICVGGFAVIVIVFVMVIVDVCVRIPNCNAVT